MLDPDYFDMTLNKDHSNCFKELSITDICLLIETFMGFLPNLKDNVKNYANSNETLNEKIN